MTQEPETERGGASIARASKHKWGYDADQVDAFLDHAHTLYESDEAALTQQDIQNVSFDLAKGGYDITQVDAALARLERAVVDKQTTREIAEHGRVAWKAQTEELYQQLIRHASRTSGERFAAGQRKQPSYNRKQVDRLVDHVIDKSASELGIDGASDSLPEKVAGLKSTDVSNAIFTQCKGKRGYDERQVDFFLNSCVQLLSRLESYARVADYVQTDGSSRTASAPVQPAETGGVTSLFSPETQYRQHEPDSEPDMPQSYAPAPDAGASFDALHQAEQAIFSSSSSAGATPVSAPSVPPAPPSFAPARPSASPVQTSFSAAPSVAPAQAASPVRQETHEAPVVDSSLAQLAHMAEVSHTISQVEPASFQPKVPELSTPRVDGVLSSIPMTGSAGAHASATAMPAVSSASSASLGNTAAMDVPSAFSRTPTTPAVSAPSPAAPSPAPAFPVDAPAQTPLRTSAPSDSNDLNNSGNSGVTSPKGAASDEEASKSDGMFSSLFPQVDDQLSMEIPDLSFPSLFGNDDSEKKAER